MQPEEEDDEMSLPSVTTIASDEEDEGAGGVDGEGEEGGEGQGEGWAANRKAATDMEQTRAMQAWIANPHAKQVWEPNDRKWCEFSFFSTLFICSWSRGMAY